MSAHIGLIVNPASHAVARRGSMLEAAALDLPGACFLRLDDFRRLAPCIRQMADAGVRQIFVEGGDGTLLAVLSACLAPDVGFADLPDFAILPGGSTNLAARSFGFRGKTAGEITGRITALAEGGPATREEHRALNVESRALDHPMVGFVLSTGSLARAMLYTQRQFHGEGQRGSRAVAGAIARFLLAPGSYRDVDGAPVLRASNLTVTTPQTTIAGAHAFGLISPLPRLSLGLAPFWGEGAGALAMTHAAWPVRGLRRALIKVMLRLTGAGMARHGFTSLRSDTIDLLHHDPVMIDGEILPMAADRRLHISTTAPLGFLR